jgi:hypothetical protein
MNIPIEPPHQVENLISLLTSDAAVRYLGRSFSLRIEVLAALKAGNRTLADVAREHGVSRQYVSKLAGEARSCFSL